MIKSKNSNSKTGNKTPKKVEYLFQKIPNLEKAYAEKYVAFYPYFKPSNYNKKGEWRPKQPVSKRNDFSHSDYWNKQFPLDKIRNNNNIAWVCGYDELEHGIHLGVIDIDGIKRLPKDADGNDKPKHWYDKKYHQKSCDIFYNILKQLKFPYISCKSWSGGYHLYFMTSDRVTTSNTRTNFFKIFEYLYFPKDFEIKELQGKPVYDVNGYKGLIEVCTVPKERPIITAPSNITDKKLDENDKLKTRKGKYELLETRDFYDLINNPVEDLTKEIKDVFLKNGFAFDEVGFNESKKQSNKTLPTKTKKTSTHRNTKSENNDNFVDVPILSPDQTESVIRECVEIIEKTVGDHHSSLIQLEGGLDNLNIPLDERTKILHKAHELSNDDEQGLDRINNSLGKTGAKQGFKSLLKKHPELEKNVQAIRELIKPLNEYLTPNLDELEYNVLELAYTNIFDVLKQENVTAGTLTTKGVLELDVVAIIDNYLHQIGIGSYERLKLYEIGCKMFYPEKANEIIVNKREYELTFHPNPTKKYDLNNYNPLDTTNKQNTYSHYHIKTTNINELSDDIKEKTEGVDKQNIQKAIEYLKIQTMYLSERNTLPLLYLKFKPKGVANDDIRASAVDFLDKQHHLKRTQVGENYIYSTLRNQYEKYDVLDLGAIITEEYGLSNIKHTDLKDIYDRSKPYSEPNTSIVRFNDGFLNVDEWKFTPNEQLWSIFTNRNYQYYWTTPPELYIPEEDNELIKIIKQITIPKNNQEDTSIYDDFCQRLASCVNRRNQYKTISLYWGQGNTAKSTLMGIIREILGEDRVRQITLNNIQDTWANPNVDVWLIEETDKQGFKDFIPILKNITNTMEYGDDEREIYTNKFKPKRNPSHIFIFTNAIPKVPFKDGRELIERMDVIEMPNRFCSNPNPNENEYLKKANANDFDRLDKKYYQNFFSYCLHSFNNALERTDNYHYPLAQTIEETYRIMNDYDPIKSFLTDNYFEDPTKTHKIKGLDIKEKCIQFCKENKINYNESKISADIGYKIKDLFGDIKTKSNGTYYYLNELNNESKGNRIYSIDKTGIYFVDKLRGDEKELYDHIHNITASEDGITYKKLSNKFTSKFDVDKTLEKLCDKNIIKMTTVPSDVD